MRRVPGTSAAAVLAASLCATGAWAALKPQPVHPQPVVNRPVHPQPVVNRPVHPQPVKPQPPIGNRQNPHHENPGQPHSADHRHPSRHPIHSYHIHNRYYPYFDGFHGFYPYYGSYYSYSYQPYYYSGYLPPAVYYPIPPGFNLRANANVFGIPKRNDEDLDRPEPTKSADRATNAQQTALAMKFIGYGDNLFAQQKFAQANDRYRKASNSAPQLADTWFRQGFALSATGRYEMALAAMKRGLRLDPKWPQSGFAIDELYGNNAMTKTAHLDALANFAEGNPDDGDLLFMIGVHLHFDGQTERAKVFFQRAVKLAGSDANAEHIRAFLRDDK